MSSIEQVEAQSSSRSRHWLLAAKPITIILATFLSLLGSFGPFVLVERFDAEINARSAEMRDIENRVSTLRTSQNDYFNAYVQANLLFALNPADTSVNRGVTGQMYRLAILDRAFPFRAMMAELAISGVFNFKATNDEYRKLSEAARADLSLASYGALNGFERKILDQAHELQDKLQQRYFAAQDEKTAAEAARETRRTLLAVMTALGTMLLLAANLIVEKKKVEE